MTEFTIAGKIPPRPSLSFNLSIVHLTASSSHFFLKLFGNNGKITLAKLSKIKNIFEESFLSPLNLIFLNLFLELTNNSLIEVLLGFDAITFLCIIIKRGTRTVLDQYEIL